MKRHRARRTGFTLVELLVVIAIITVLIAIAMPVFSRARASARRTACMANMRQLAVAVRMYRLDFGHFPGPYDPATGQGGLNALYPTQLDNRVALICSDDSLVSNTDYIEQVVTIDGREFQYRDLLERADTMYLWEDPGFFVEHYSSYNKLYNWMGYVWFYPPEDDETPYSAEYQLLDFTSQQLSWGDNIAFWYMWHRWDPGGDFGLWDDPNVFEWVDKNLHKHLAQQVYWHDYFGEVNLRSDEQVTRLTDNLHRPLWNPANPDQSRYGSPSAVFPGLMNRNAPDNTIITRCPHHRASGGGEAGQDIVLRLDGQCLLVPGLSYDWAVQPRQAH